MSMKNIFFQGLLSGLLSTFAAGTYFIIYQTTLQTSFDKIINLRSIAGASMVGTMLITMGYVTLYKYNNQRLAGVLNIFIVILSFMSIITPISMSLPLDIESPELFPGLVVPMHFFPALVYFSLGPFFQQKNK